jgi:aryl-alcohol dehydrogenase-like predicted oxidoreductase
MLAAASSSLRTGEPRSATSAHVAWGAVTQVKYSILDRGPERDGTVAKCADLGVSVIAHSPLEQGLLTARGLEGTDQKAQQVCLRPARVMQIL